MNSAGDSKEVESEASNEQGFAVYTLRSRTAQVSVVPELGAKVISLRNLRSGREWMWHPHAGRKLFVNQPGDAFSLSTLAGMDECLPTIAPCRWRERELPDHGEVWSAPWELDMVDWTKAALTTRINLRLSPLKLERTLTLAGNQIRLDYHLHNCGRETELFLWAMHPLLRIEPNDRLELPKCSQPLLPGGVWTQPLVSVLTTGQCAKLFLSPMPHGVATVRNATTGDGLEFAWSPTENRTLGVWLTRGGWFGHEHFALEPTNGQPDALDVAASRRSCGSISPDQVISWTVDLKLS